MSISKSRGTLGVRQMPDQLDSGFCHLSCRDEAEVRVNLDGVWTSLCAAHKDALVEALSKPEPKPQPRPMRELRPTWEDLWYD